MGAERFERGAGAIALAVALVAGSCAATSAAASVAPAAAPGRNRPANTTGTTTAAPGPTGTLVVEAATEARLTNNFNPFDADAPLEQMGVPSYIYEPLVEYDELQIDQYYPWLAESWSFSTTGETLTFDIRPGVRWDDGSALTASDVAYTFNLLKQYPALNDGIPIVSAVATDPRTFTLTLSRPGYTFLSNIARVPIVKSGFAAGSDPRHYLDKAPDGTGPYVLSRPGDATPAKVTLTSRPGYWQRSEPTVHELVFPAYSDAAAVNTALQDGTLDWASSFMTDPAKYVKKDQADNHYWFPPVDCISLELNLGTYPGDQLAVRQAVSLAIDRNSLSAQAEGGYAPPVTSTSGMVLPTDSQFLTPADTNDVNDNGDTATSALVMKLGGFRMSARGTWANGAGRPVSFSIEDPEGTALATSAGVIARQLRAAGFDVAAKVLTAGRWRSDVTDGHFQASVLTSSSGPSPYYMYRDWLDPTLIVGGQALGGNYERLDAATDPSLASSVSRDLDLYAGGPSGSPAAAAVIQALADVVSWQVPVVPLMYGPDWGEFSTRHATGWPSTQDPYEPGSPSAPFAEYTVLQLSPS